MNYYQFIKYATEQYEEILYTMHQYCLPTDFIDNFTGFYWELIRNLVFGKDQVDAYEEAATELVETVLGKSEVDYMYIFAQDILDKKMKEHDIPKDERLKIKTDDNIVYFPGL